LKFSIINKRKNNFIHHHPSPLWIWRNKVFQSKIRETSGMSYEMQTLVRMSLFPKAYLGKVLSNASVTVSLISKW
jgi:hypothetical protein